MIFRMAATPSEFPLCAKTPSLGQQPSRSMCSSTRMPVSPSRSWSSDAASTVPVSRRAIASSAVRAHVHPEHPYFDGSRVSSSQSSNQHPRREPEGSHPESAPLDFCCEQTVAELGLPAPRASFPKRLFSCILRIAFLWDSCSKAFWHASHLFLILEDVLNSALHLRQDFVSTTSYGIGEGLSGISQF